MQDNDNLCYNLKQNIYILIRNYTLNHYGKYPEYIMCNLYTFSYLLSYLSQEIYYTNDNDYFPVPTYQGIKIGIINNIREEKFMLWVVEEAEWREFK